MMRTRSPGLNASSASWVMATNLPPSSLTVISSPVLRVRLLRQPGRRRRLRPAEHGAYRGASALADSTAGDPAHDRTGAGPIPLRVPSICTWRTLSTTPSRTLCSRAPARAYKRRRHARRTAADCDRQRRYRGYRGNKSHISLRLPDPATKIFFETLRDLVAREMVFCPPRLAILIAPIQRRQPAVSGQSSPAAMPYNNPARKASPQPVGSSTSRALTQGISIC